MYQQNNIEFRIASADATSKFKATQAHSFLQVCRREFQFDISAREVVLLSYDRFSGWLLKLERSFVTEHGRSLSPRMVRLAYDLFAEELNKIEEICMENPAIFKTDVCELLKVIHSYAKEVVAYAITKAQSISVPSAFVMLSEIISDYLQHVLIAMHEFNNNIVLKKTPFIGVHHFSLLSKPHFISMLTRAQFYSTRLTNSAEFTVKNYTHEDISNELVRALSEIGITAKTEELEESSM